MGVAQVIKKIELFTYRKYMEYNRSKYALHDLQRKLRTLEIRPIKSEDFNLIRKFYKLYGIRVDKRWFDLFNTLAKVNQKANLKHYIPHDIYYKYIDSYFSNVRKCGFVDDKSLYGVYFHDVLQPRTVLLKQCHNNTVIYLDENYRLLSKSEAVDLIKSYKHLIVKQSVYSSGGKGVWFYDSDSNQIDDILDCKNSLVVQEILPQHEVLNKLHKDSLNTIRIMTLILDNKVYILSSILRMGQGGSKVDNASSGGLFCGIEENGQLKNFGYDCDGRIYDYHPQGTMFNSITIPNFDKCKDLVKKLAPRISSFTHLCSWDIAINNDGAPVLIEANMTFGELDFHQMCNGPVFGDLTERVLNEVFR